VSISFLDQVRPGTLPSRDETLDFTVSTTPTDLVLSLKYPTGRMETIYQAGVIGTGYSVVIDGSTFHVSRAGGWPAGQFDLVFTEAATAPSSAWTVLYDCDLAAQATQTIQSGPTSTYKNFTLDGQPWYFHGASGAASITNGVGMTMQGQGRDGYDGCRVGLRVYAMPGYDPAKLTAVQVRFGSSSGYVSGDSCFGADMWAGLETWGMGGVMNTTPIFLYGATDLRQHDAIYSSFMQSSIQKSSLALLNTMVFGVVAYPWNGTNNTAHQYSSRLGIFQKNVLSSAMPVMEDMEAFRAYYSTGTGENANYKMGAFVGSRTGATTTATLTRLRILQKPRTASL